MDVASDQHFISSLPSVTVLPSEIVRSDPVHSDRSAFRSALSSQIAGILLVLVCVAWCGFDATHSRTFAAESTEASIALYADAANFQTGGAIELAIQNWKKLRTDPGFS